MIDSFHLSRCMDRIKSLDPREILMGLTGACMTIAAWLFWTLRPRMRPFHGCDHALHSILFHGPCVGPHSGNWLPRSPSTLMKMLFDIWKAAYYPSASSTSPIREAGLSFKLTLNGPTKKEDLVNWRQSSCGARFLQIGRRLAVLANIGLCYMPFQAEGVWAISNTIWIPSWRTMEAALWFTPSP